jgi:hypothetical protein
MAMMKPKPVKRSINNFVADGGASYKAGIKTGIRAGIKKNSVINDPIKARQRAKVLERRMKAMSSELYKMKKASNADYIAGREEPVRAVSENNRRGKTQGRLIARNAQTSRRVSNKGKAVVRRGRGD